MNHRFITSISAAITLLALLGAPQAASADSCQPIIESMHATLKAPAIKQFLKVKGSDQEKLMSIMVGDSVYLMMGSTKAFSKMPRSEIDKTAQEAEAEKSFSNCKQVGTEQVNGVTTIVYTYSYQAQGESGQTKVWIGQDGFLRKQSTDEGELRYDYDNVTAPGN
jgi:hypothetical protein